MSHETMPAQGPVDVNVSRRDWRKDYQDAYLAANGHSAEVVEAGRGWYKIKTQEGHQIGCKYQRKKIIAMTARLIARSTTANAAVTGGESEA